MMTMVWILGVACGASEILKITLNSFPVKATPGQANTVATPDSDHQKLQINNLELDRNIVQPF